MNKLEQAIEQARTRLPYGYAVLMVIKKGKIGVILNHLDESYQEPIDKDATVPDQIEALIEDALEMRGPQPVRNFILARRLDRW